MPRRKTTASKRSVDFDDEKFVSRAAVEKYDSLYLGKSIIPERGFLNPGGRTEGVIMTRNWYTFTAPPCSAVVPLVREFYANAHEARDGKVFVRGVWVPIDEGTINRLYETENFDQDDYSAFLGGEIDYNNILRFLCVQNVNVAWKRKDNLVVNFPSSGLTPESRAWHYFITAKLLPSGHVSEVTRERAVLNYCIQSNFSINVGRIINRSIINTLSAHSSVGIGHPSLIHQLCIDHGVAFSSSEETVGAKAPITRKNLFSYAAKIPLERGESSSQARRSPPQRLSLSDQVGRLKDQVRNLDSSVREQNDRSRRTEKKIDSLTRRVEHVGNQQHNFFGYVSDFNNSMVDMFSNCSLNVGAGQVHFPTAPTYGYYESPEAEEEEEEEEEEEDDMDE